MSSGGDHGPTREGDLSGPAEVAVDLEPFLSDLWVTADQHFGHVNIIRYCGRPFSGEPEQTHELARRWRETVPWDAPLLHLGDLVMGPYDPGIWEPIRQLLGNPRWLVRGNHDTAARLGGIEAAGFTLIAAPSVVYRDWDVLLTHRPVEPLPSGRVINVHGHIHEKPAPSDRHINLAVEQTDYRPMLLVPLLDRRIDELEVAGDLGE